MSQLTDALHILRHVAELRFEEELRGYSKSQVDRVLQRLAPLAEEFDAMQARLSEAETRAASAEARLLEHSGSENDVIAPPVAAPVPTEAVAAPPVPTTADPAATGIPPAPADFDETLRKTLVLAQRTADETVKEAYDEAERVRGNAHSEADLLLGKARSQAEQVEIDAAQRQTELAEEAERQRSERLAEIDAETEKRRNDLETALAEAEGAERAELLEQITNLQHLRNALTSDIENLEGHLSERREIIQGALDEIANVLDDPSRLRSEANPETTELEPIDAGDYPDIGIHVEDLTAADTPTHEESEPLAHTAGPDPDGVGPPTQEYSAADLASPVEADHAEPTSQPEADFHGETASDDQAGFDLGSVTPSEAVSDVEAEPDTSQPTDPWAEAAITATERADEATGEHQLSDLTAPDGTLNLEAGSPSTDLPPPPEAPSQDPFLDELRKATSEEAAEDDDALDRFLEGEPEEDRKPWFGRRR